MVSWGNFITFFNLTYLFGSLASVNYNYYVRQRAKEKEREEAQKREQEENLAKEDIQGKERIVECEEKGVNEHTKEEDHDNKGENKGEEREEKDSENEGELADQNWIEEIDNWEGRIKRNNGE